MTDIDQLIMQLTQADAVCRQANAHFTKSDNIKATTAEVDTRAARKRTLAIGIGIVIFIVLNLIHDKIARIAPSLGVAGEFVVIVISIVAVRIMFRKINEMADEEKKKIKQKALDEFVNGELVFQNNIEKLRFLNTEYWYPVATGFLIKVLKDGRAHNLPEAIDKFEEQKHRWKLEEAANQMSQMQAAQAAQIESLRGDIYNLQSRVK